MLELPDSRAAAAGIIILTFRREIEQQAAELSAPRVCITLLMALEI
jgi:hypothetical protein